MVCEEEHHAGDSVDESHSTGTEVEARVSCFEISGFACICTVACVHPAEHRARGKGCHRGVKMGVKV